jgi:hypothetical protein
MAARRPGELRSCEAAGSPSRANTADKATAVTPAAIAGTRSTMS